MLGQRLSDRYEILAELGRGGMGVVYRARDPLLNRDVAVKLVAPGLLTPQTEQRFKDEAQVVAQMDHPAIVPIYDVGRHEDSLFFVMPIVQGESLKDLIREQKLRLGEVIDIGVEVAEALDYSHTRGVVHRDIKPENLMVSRESGGSLRIRIMDFGLARRSKVSGLTKTGMLIGTLRYVSPEQLMSQAVDGRSDIYSLGVSLYECLAGDVPFTGDLKEMLYRIVHELPQSPRALGADIDEQLEELILSCLAKEPERRPPTAGDLARSLAAYRSGLVDNQRMRSIVTHRATAPPRPAPSPFFGRRAEMKELQQRLNLATAGECQFVALSGEPGVGKTRLLDELGALARARNVRVLHGRFVEQDAAFPYHGFCEAIQEWFRLRESDSSGSALPDFSDLADDLISLFPMFSEIESIRAAASGPGQPVPLSEPRSVESRAQIFELLARTLARLAGGKALVLLLEDLHGDEASVEALQYVVRRLGPTPTLIIGTYRSTEIDRHHALTRVLEGFQGDRRFSSLALKPLSPSEHRSLLAALVAGAELADSLARQLYEVSEGNPFFTKELLRSFIDSGSVVQDDTGSWTLSDRAEISPEALPATIHQAVEKRVGRLPDDLRSILSVAAVIGKSFEFRDLEVLAQDPTGLDDAVERLVREGLIEEEARSRVDRLSFSSGVIREVLYGELPRRRRRQLHRKYAEVLEKRHAGRLERVYPQLVHHFSEGDMPEKTVKYGLLHARKSLEAFSPDEAIRSAQTALEFLDEDWAGDRLLEAEARMLLAAGWRSAADSGRALREIDLAVRIFESEGQTGRLVGALLEAAHLAWQARRTEETRRWVERGVEAARAAGETEPLRQLLSLAATLANLRGEYARAGEYLQEAERLGATSREAEQREELPHGGTLVVALTNPVAARQPAEAQLGDESEVYSNAFECLLATDEQGNLVPALAEEWAAGDDGRSFVFSLRPGVRFEGGEPLTASDVKRSFERSVREVAPHLPSAFAAIRGVDELVEKRADGLSGLVVRADGRLEILLNEKLPIYPALLTDSRTAITGSRVAGGARDGCLAGTGPFRLATQSSDRVVVERSPDYWKGTAANVDAIEFRHGLSAAAIAAGLRSGELDLARDLLPQDLDDVLRDPRFRGRIVEAPTKTTYFVLFNALGGALREAAVRQALSSVVRTRDLVWRTLGRFAQPAAGYLPPGILGHDPGRRPQHVTVEQAREMLRASGVEGPLQLRAAVHPLIRDRYKALLEALFSAWSDLGVQTSIVNSDMASYLEIYANAGQKLDLLVTRWIPDYDDPDNFTHTLFNSDSGLLRNYFSSAEVDELLEAARVESRPAVREGLYRRFEKLLLDGGHLLPLLQDVDYRIAGSRIRGVKLSSSVPYVNYSELAKGEAPAVGVEPRQETSGTIHVPMTGRITTLDPALSTTPEQDEVLPSIFETLTRDVGDAQIVPWLAASFAAEDGGRSYRFRLREGVRFHDGRPLTARDVRHSLERLLQDPEGPSRWQYLPVRGAKALLEGTARDLAGFRIHSSGEFTIELERPVSFFPGLLSFTSAAVIPEGTADVGSSWREGAVGTGPFRVTRFLPGQRLELERHPTYWRERCPASQGMVFEFGLSPDEVLSGFRGGRFALASDLFPADVDQLRREPRFAAGYRETPRLSTTCAAFNVHEGPLKSRSLRRRLVQALDVARLVRQTLGRVAIPAHGLIPPGLLGAETPSRPSVGPEAPADTSVDVELSAAVHPVFLRQYSAFFEKLREALLRVGVSFRVTTETLAELIESRKQSTVDVAFVQWVADYPDADSFVHILQSQKGFIGRLCGSPEIDRLIGRGRSETDPGARHAIYRQVEELLSQEGRLLPLFHEQAYRFARPEVEGLSISYRSPVVAYENLGLRQP